ncbi:hypothetical protein MLD38_000483 [Melastoma candidum]|uniref:Uncharacterized protein n=1 Tax=Melastoma candidum TaxID=119954 RepID=A0ACB9SAC4_9MYRT|nr:hypothetical protein MLD38_000483 [Melastoma candidum]
MIPQPSALSLSDNSPPTSCNESGISVAFTTLEINPQMHRGGSAGDQQNHGFVLHQMNFSASTSSNVCYPSAVPLAAPRVPGVPINYGLPPSSAALIQQHSCLWRFL